VAIGWGTRMKKNRHGERFGRLRPKYDFSLNPYPELRFSRCPDCGDRTGQRKVPLLIWVEPRRLVALNYTNRYCYRCDMLIGHKHEIEKHLTELFSRAAPDIVGNSYLIIGTVEKPAWRENITHPKPLDAMLEHVHDFKSYQVIRATAAGWFPKGQDPPIMAPPPSTHWVKRR